MCRLSSWLPDGTPLLGRAFDRHRAKCERCQTDATRLRMVARDLGDLDSEMVHAPGGLHAEVMAKLPRQDASDPRRPLAVRLVIRHALVVVVVAVALLAAILARRERRRA